MVGKDRDTKKAKKKAQRHQPLEAQLKAADEPIRKAPRKKEKRRNKNEDAPSEDEVL
jgi:hypothetical protein